MKKARYSARIFYLKRIISLKIVLAFVLEVYLNEKQFYFFFIL